MIRLQHTLSMVICLGLSLPLPAADNPVSTAQDGWNFTITPAQLSQQCDETLAGADKALRALETDTAAATLQRVYGGHDTMMLGLQPIQHVSYMKSVHPDTAVQAAAEACITAYSDFSVSMNLSPGLYRRMAAIDTENLSSAEKLMVEKRLRDFRQAGVDRDQATRDKVRELVAEITELGTGFDRTIREDRRFVAATPAQLTGLPEDFLASRQPEENGKVRISTDYPDYFPVMKYSADDELRRALFLARMNIATPTNETNLKALIARRAELAKLLGYDSHAALAMDGLMIENPQRAQAFLSEIGASVKAPAAKDMTILLGRSREIVPDSDRVQAWQASYLSNLVRQEQYALDAREVREYFHFERVQTGIFRLTEDLFGVQIIPWDTQTWHSDVTAWEVRENGAAIGRFYLDMHPRENKYKHAAHWTLRTGLKRRQLPLSGMAMNFPRGLMEHNQVETFLHEFGHLLHNMFSGEQDWLDISGMSMERDFVEAPSQMLEQWVWDYDTLRRFAVNAEGETIPADLVAKMNRARHFGEAAGVAGQLFYANLSLNYYNRDPVSFELLPLLQDLQAKYSPLPYVQGTHFYNSFGHLNGYSSNYYIYQWSQAIATDLFSRFQAEGLRNRNTANDYRRKVLAPGGSKPAADAVADFLDRPFSTEAYRVYLGKLEQGQSADQSEMLP